MIVLSLALSLVSASNSLAPELVEIARKALSDSLRDYDGSRFRSFRVVRTGSRVTFCGEANLRNGAGGFTGWQPIAVVVAGEPGPAVYAVAPNGVTGLVDVSDRCPVGDYTPPGAMVEVDDVTASIAPPPTATNN